MKSQRTKRMPKLLRELGKLQNAQRDEIRRLYYQVVDALPRLATALELSGGPEAQTAWFAYNKATKQSIEFGSFDEARDFCFHPDNSRQRETMYQNRVTASA